MKRSDIMKYIGTRLAEERAELDITQTEFGKLLGCSQPQYGRYENGERSLSAVELYELAVHLQVPVERFYPTRNRKDLDESERELLEAWRSKDLRVVLRLMSERFGD